jgi:hypothetical protein
MKKRFLAIHPLIGTKKKPTALRFMQRSPYYWWWAYLRRNTDYLATCAEPKVGKLASLYADFGDVRNDDFRSWWGGSEQRGAYLFAEQAPAFRLNVLKEKEEWQDYLATSDNVVVIAVNMAIGRRKLQSDFAALLAQTHQSQQGRPAMQSVKSTARYPLYRNYTIDNLRRMLAAYDAWLENELRPASQRLKQWQLGESIKLVPDAMTTKNDMNYRDKRNVMSVTFNKFVKRASIIIANTTNGHFPNSDPQASKF